MVSQNTEVFRLYENSVGKVKYTYCNKIGCQIEDDIPIIDTAFPGAAYFVHAEQDQQVNIYGQPTDINTSYKIPIHHGWNLIANPFNISLAAENIKLVDDFYQFSLPDAVSLGYIKVYKIDSFSGVIPNYVTHAGAWEPWTGYMVYISYGTNMIFEPDSSNGTTTINVARHVNNFSESSSVSQPINEANLGIVSSQGNVSQVVGYDGEIIDVNLYAEAEGFEDGSILVDYDETVVEACVRDAANPSTCVAVSGVMRLTQETLNPDSGFIIVDGGYESSVRIELVSMGALTSNPVNLGKLSFRVLPGGETKSTEILVRSDDPKLVVMGTVNDTYTSNYEITTEPLVFEGAFYSPPGEDAPQVYVNLNGLTGVQYVHGVVQVEVIALDAAGGTGIDRVEFYVGDDVLLESQAGESGLFYFAWDTTGTLESGERIYPDGEHGVYAVAYDKMGNSLRSATVYAYVDNTPPVIDAVQLSNDGYFSTVGNSPFKNILISPQVTEGLSYEVTVEIGRGSKADDTWEVLTTRTGVVNAGGAPAQVEWNGSLEDGSVFESGEFLFYVTATDMVGNISEAATGVIVIDSEAPEVHVVEPVDGIFLAGNIVVSADAADQLTDIDSVVYSRVLKGGTTPATVYPLSYDVETGLFTTTWVTGEPDDGIYDIEVIATDKAGNTANETHTLIVANSPAAIVSTALSPEAFSTLPIETNPKRTATIEFSVMRVSTIVGAYWYIEIFNKSTEQLVKSKTGTIQQYGPNLTIINPFEWTGRDENENVVDDGYYDVYVRTVTFSGKETKKLIGTVLVDGTLPVITDMAVVPDFFNPDGNGVDDTSNISAQVIEAHKMTIDFHLGAGGYELEKSTDVVPDETEATLFEYVWDGIANGPGGDEQLVPDGIYPITITATDIAGNVTTINTTVEKDNPPLISVTNSTVAFSPNADSIKDVAEVEWAADQEGLFVIELLSKEDMLLATISDEFSNLDFIGMASTNTWQGLDAEGNVYPEDVYKMRITGRDANSRIENPCVPIIVSVILDITSPVLTAYYPLENEFTALDPVFKVDVSDNLSGFGWDEVFASENTLFSISGESDSIPAMARMIDNLSYRATGTPEIPLVEGVHNLSAEAWDLAGNKGTLEQTRFVSIPAMEDDFEDGMFDVSLWEKLESEDLPGIIGVNDGKIVLSHTNDKPSYELKDVTTYGTGFRGRGTVDVTRPYVEIGLTGLIMEGTGDAYRAGVSLDSSSSFEDTGGDSAALFIRNSGGLNYVIAYIAIEGLYRRILIQENISFEEPVDLKIVYDEGLITFYVNDEELTNYEMEMEYVTAGVFADSGFKHDGPYDESSIRAVADSITSNLASPKLNTVQIIDETSPEAATVIIGEDELRFEVAGTPWQKDVSARVLGLDWFTPDFSTSALNDITIGNPVYLVETHEGSGVYTSAGTFVLDSFIDNLEREASTIIASASNGSYEHFYYPEVNLVFGNLIRPETDAVQKLSLSNEDYPEGYAYIREGDRLKVIAETRPGDWEIELYLLNDNAIQGNSNLQESAFSGPVTMTKIGEGRYEYTTVLGPTSVNGIEASSIIGWVTYGAQEDRRSLNNLYTLIPPIEYVSIDNDDRPGSGDVKLFETVQVSTIGAPGQTLYAVMYNGEKATGAANQLYFMGEPFLLSEATDDEGKYTGSVTIKVNFDRSGYVPSSITVLSITTTGTVTFSHNSLNLLVADSDAPEKPLHPVHLPLSGEPVLDDETTAAFTWTVPATNESGSALEDLIGFNVYRVDEQGGSAIINIAAGSEPLSLTGESAYIYSLSNSSISVNGIDYNMSHFAGGESSWYEKGSRDLISLPLINTPLIDSGKDVFVYAIDMVFTDIRFGYGGYHMTIFSQETPDEISRWLSKLKTIGVADEPSRIVSVSKAYRALPDNTFTPYETLTSLKFNSYEKIIDEPVGVNLYQDNYLFSGAYYRYAVSSVDSEYNESEISEIASIPESSIVANSLKMHLFNKPDDMTYTDGDTTVTIEAETDGDFPAVFDAYLVNREALESRTPFEQIVLTGPNRLNSVGGGKYISNVQLNEFIDHSGRTVNSVIAVVKESNSRENITADGYIKKSILDGTIVPYTNEIISGDPIEFSYTVKSIVIDSISDIKIGVRIVDAFDNSVLGEYLINDSLNLDPGETFTTSFQILSSSGYTTQKNCKLELIAILNEEEDMIADSSVQIVPEKVVVNGIPIPESIVQYQEPLFTYTVENKTISTINDGIITAKILSQDAGNNEVYATFTESRIISGLDRDKKKTFTSRFTPVNAAVGMHRIVVYYQASEQDNPVEVFTTEIYVESCE